MTRSDLENLGLTNAFVDHLLGINEIKSILCQCHKPIEIYKTNLLDKDIVPLWEYGVRIAFYDRTENVYKFVTSVNESNVWFSSKTLQGALAILFESLFDFVSENDMRDVAGKFGFVHFDKMLKEGDDIFDDHAYDAWLKEFDKNA